MSSLESITCSSKVSGNLTFMILPTPHSPNDPSGASTTTVNIKIEGKTVACQWTLSCSQDVLETLPNACARATLKVQ